MINTKQAGRIEGNPISGLCERICIEVTRVIDGCVTRQGNQLFTLTLTDISPDAVAPFTFVSLNNSGDSAFNNVSVITGDGQCSRVSGELVIPIIVTFKDANGNIFAAKSSISINRDILLRLPVRQRVPYVIKNAVSVFSSVGSFASPNTVNVQACYVIITKAVVNEDVLVPIYGRCNYPECSSCNIDICEEVLPLPFFSPNT